MSGESIWEAKGASFLARAGLRLYPQGRPLRVSKALYGLVVYFRETVIHFSVFSNCATLSYYVFRPLDYLEIHG